MTIPAFETGAPTLLTGEYRLVRSAHLRFDQLPFHLEPEFVTELMREHPTDRTVRSTPPPKCPPDRNLARLSVPRESLEYSFVHWVRLITKPHALLGYRPWAPRSRSSGLAR